MARLHLFEIEDQAWCPNVIRESTTDFLLSLCKALDLYEPAFKKIADIARTTNTNMIIDCCSGSGGTIEQLVNYFNETKNTELRITLTDKYPNLRIFKKLEKQYANRIIGCTESVDARDLPASLKGMRTFFSSFHHFTPEQAVKILQNTVDNNSSIAIFECTQRHPSDFIRMIFSPIMMMVLLPLAKKLNWKKFIFTYIIPITLVTNMWDFFVSSMRTYSVEEMHALVNQLNAPSYHWEIGRLWSKKAMCHLPYLIGYKLE